MAEDGVYHQEFTVRKAKSNRRGLDESLPVIEARQNYATTGASQALEEYCESLISSFPWLLMTIMLLELRDMMFYHLLMDLEDGVRPITQEDGELKFFKTSNNKAVKLPSFMRTGFVAKLLVHIYRTRPFVFGKTYNSTTNAAVPAKAISKLVRKDPYNLGLQLQQLISKIIVIWDGCGRHWNEQSMTLRPEHCRQLRETFSGLHFFESLNCHLTLEVRVETRFYHCRDTHILSPDAARKIPASVLHRSDLR